MVCTMSDTADVIIVGGGVIGVSIAYHLARRQVGHIVLLERDSLGCGSTGRSVASIDGLTLQPRAAALFARSASFFAHCDDLLGAPCGFVQTGSIVLAGPKQEERLGAAVSRMQAAGLDVQSLNPDELAALEPRMVLNGVASTSFTPGAGYADPVLTTQALAGAARRLGVEIQQGRMVTGLRCERDRVSGVETAVGPISAPITIVASGPWSGELLQTAGIKLPLQPVRHPVVCLRRLPAFGPAHHSLLDLTTGIYGRAETGGLTLLGSINPDVGYDPIKVNDGAGYVHDDYIFWTMARLVQRFPMLKSSELLKGWAGIMTITPDWQPVIGRWPNMPGLYCAAGFSGQGFQISPAVGDLLSGSITGSTLASEFLASFAPTRFDAKQLLRINQEGEMYGLLG